MLFSRPHAARVATSSTLASIRNCAWFSSRAPPVVAREVLGVDGKSVPLRIHAILDDHRRYMVAIQACSTERDAEMVRLMVEALRLHAHPTRSTSTTDRRTSATRFAAACRRLGIGLLRAKPHDPQAHGKMEQLSRTLREQCLDHLGTHRSLHDVQVRLLAWLDRHYLCTPHSALMRKTPAQVYELAAPALIPETMLREAIIVRGRRRVRRDGTLSVAGTDFEIDATYLCGKLVTGGRCLLDPSERPWLEHEEQRLPLRPVDAKANAKRTRKKRAKRGIDAVAFDPKQARLDALVHGDER